MPPAKRPSASDRNIYATPATRPAAPRALSLVNPLREPPSFANQLTVDRAYAAITSAAGGNMGPLYTLYRDMVGGDTHVQSEVETRKLGVLNERPRFVAPNPNAQADKDALAFCEAALRECKRALDAEAHLLDSFGYPVSIVEKIYEGVGTGFRLVELFPVKHCLVDYRDGTLRLFDTDEKGNILPTSHEADPARYIIHRGHLLSTADTQGGPFRAILMWWLLRNMDRSWWGRLLERFGAPFMVGKCDSDDEASRQILEHAFSLATRIGGIVVSNETSVELQSAMAGTSTDAFEKFLTVCNREISKLISGQASSEQQTTGLGSGISKQQEQKRADRRQWDSIRLGATLREQLFQQLLEANGFPGAAPYVSWGSESSEELKAMADVLGSLKDAGLEVDDPGIQSVAERVGIPLRRIAPPAPPINLPPNPRQLALNNEPTEVDQQATAFDDITRAAAAPLSQAFSGRYAGIRQIVLNSASADDCERQIRAHLADRAPSEVADVLEKALVALAANAVFGS